MKKVLLLITFLFSIVCFSQAITINTTTYTSDELVKTVLTNNSPCINIRNVQSSTGTSAIPSSTNGIGYFTNTNPNFPLQNGVILTTGNVLNSPGPNTTTLSDGTLAWNGDSALENALAAAGVTMVSKNATVLEFDFTPISPNFNFQFLFASEEYGTYQCFSPDAFAFLLTDSFGVTQNLAVIPNTTIPISVQTIRNTTYNPSCTSENAGFFGLFNDGTAAAASATNYNGQTVLMNASSTSLVPNTTYHIKLVIADGNNDNQFDSAVFLGGGSFNFGQDVLGPDLTINTNSALCSNNGINEPYTITSGLDSNLFDFVWKDANGIPIPGATNSDLTINQAGTYLLTYYVQSTNCEVATNNITIEYNSVVFTNEPLDLFLCSSGQSSYTFDFNSNQTLVQTSGVNVTFHELENEAENEQAAIPLIYNVNAVDLPKTIWIRAEDNFTGLLYY
ncbi:choice-of-anchor L domain-containing protein [Flavobacterium sp.]|uniref:choice-of-anchor L domain-containing protein n=1 Tax=Flavobacterium sp. TaxID=239 RepID=UPI00286D948E|nr:choice-of-anchor L domain-containing protein [Flavobacterium sp.]